MRPFLVLAVLVAVAMMANASRPCDNGGPIAQRFVPFPAPVPTPGGHVATGVYVDDRAQGDINVGGVRVGSPLGFVAGDGTWLYFETNGQPGLQRGGHPSIDTCLPFCGSDPGEFYECAVADPDELIL